MISPWLLARLAGEIVLVGVTWWQLGRALVNTARSTKAWNAATAGLEQALVARTEAQRLRDEAEKIKRDAFDLTVAAAKKCAAEREGAQLQREMLTDELAVVHMQLFWSRVGQQKQQLRVD